MGCSPTTLLQELATTCRRFMSRETKEECMPTLLLQHSAAQQFAQARAFCKALLDVNGVDSATVHAGERTLCLQIQ